MIDGAISAALGAYLFLMGLGAIGKPAETSEKRETQERARPILKVGGALTFLFGLAQLIGLV